jgi:cyclopropane fatty-acyl-phospholipid synthase-like methyltransferase
VGQGQKLCATLIELLVEKAGIQSSSRILDIGCGIGATANYLASIFRCEVVGVTLSPVQAAIAERTASCNKTACRFVAMDAEESAIAAWAEFDVIWSIEALSHMTERRRVLTEAIGLMKPGGIVAIVDWFKRDSRVSLADLERSMLVPLLDTQQAYDVAIQACGCSMIAQDDITDHVRKTWDI